MEQLSENKKATLKAKYKNLWNNYYSRCPLFVAWKKEILNQQNITILINGDTRSGKSFVALKIAEAMDYIFQDPEQVKKRFVFSSRQFLTLLKDPDLEPGSVIVWEEVGVGLKSKRWYEDINQLIIDVLQVYGHKSLILIFTTPQKRFLDKDARVLCNQYIETSRKNLDLKRKTNRISVHRIENSSKFDKSYFKNYIFYGTKVSKWTFTLPKNKALVKAYEEHSRERKKKIEADSEQRVINQDARESKEKEEESLTPEYIAEYVLRERNLFLKRRKKDNKVLIDGDHVIGFFKINESGTTWKNARRLIMHQLKLEEEAYPRPPPVEVEVERQTNVGRGKYDRKKRYEPYGQDFGKDEDGGELSIPQD